MIVCLPPDVVQRLDDIEALEGVEAAEIMRQATSIFSMLDAEGRMTLGFAAMQILVDRTRGSNA